MWLTVTKCHLNVLFFKFRDSPDDEEEEEEATFGLKKQEEDDGLSDLSGVEDEDDIEILNSSQTELYKKIRIVAAKVEPKTEAASTTSGQSHAAAATVAAVKVF